MQFQWFPNQTSSKNPFSNSSATTRSANSTWQIKAKGLSLLCLKQWIRKTSVAVLHVCGTKCYNSLITLLSCNKYLLNSSAVDHQISCSTIHPKKVKTNENVSSSKFSAPSSGFLCNHSTAPSTIARHSNKAAFIQFGVAYNRAWSCASLQHKSLKTRTSKYCTRKRKNHGSNFHWFWISNSVLLPL